MLVMLCEGVVGATSYAQGSVRSGLVWAKGAGESCDQSHRVVIV